MSRKRTVKDVTIASPIAQPLNDEERAAQAIEQATTTPKLSSLDKARQNLSKYPQAIPESLKVVEGTTKLRVTIKCVDCGAEREVFTSDLFQVTRCLSCTKKSRTESRKLRKAIAKDAGADVAQVY